MNQAIRKTVFNSWHRSHGAHMFQFAGWEMPLNYETGIVGEHLATRKFAGLFDISHMGRFSVSGEGVLRSCSTFSRTTPQPWTRIRGNIPSLPTRAEGRSTTPIFTGWRRRNTFWW